MLTPAFIDLLCFYFVCCAEKVILPVVCLFGTRVGGTRVKVVTEGVYLKFPATTSRERLLRNAITGIWAPMDVEKNVCQRLADQVSSLR
jgi:hypothetical protein